MIAKHITPSPDISQATASEASVSGAPVADASLDGIRRSCDLEPTDSTAGAADITRLPDFWTSKETVNQTNDPNCPSRMHPADINMKPLASETDATRTETPSSKNAVGTDKRSTTSKDLGSSTASKSFALSFEANDAGTMVAGIANLNVAESLIGREVGPYVVTGELGQGGMGVVYKARHKLLRREVALKIILRSGVDSEVISRFREEARSVATLKHPGIVQIHEYGEHQGIPWFALEFVEGITLAQLIGIKPLDPERAARMIADVASAVGHAHDCGVLHRDIKPANVLIAEGDIAKLTDFGLAKQVTSDLETSGHKTIDGQIMGTPGFMSPEQARGIVGQIRPHSDQYSLGATLYCLLTGRAPFVGDPIDVVLQVINNEPLTVRQLQPSTPMDLETICLKAMSKEPARRYPDCAAFEADLRRFLRHEPIVARPVGNMQRMIWWCRRNPKVAIPVLTTMLSVLMALGISLWSAITLSAKNSDIEKQNKEIVEQNNEIRLQKTKAETAQHLAEKNETEARKNAQEAFDRGVAVKDTVAEIMTIVRIEMPSSEDKLRIPREKLLRRVSELLDILPDNPGDAVLRTGLEKARVLEERYYTALELGEPSKAIEYLDSAERILRERNVALGTDASRKNLQSVLYHQIQARTSAKRDMEKVCQIGKESLNLLNDVLDHPNPVNFDINAGSIPRIATLTDVLIQGYLHALALKNLGRVREGLTVLDRTLVRFDEAMVILRAENYQNLSDDQWNEQKQNLRGMLSDQDHLHAILLAAVGRDQEASALQAASMIRTRKLAASQPSIETAGKLSLALLFAGDMARQRGQIDEAIAAYEEMVKITREFYLDNPKLDDRRSRHNVSLMRLAGLLRFRDLARARELYTEAHKIAEQMVQADDKAIAMYFALALVSPFSGPPQKAVELAQEILQRVEPGTVPDAEFLVNVARVFAASADAESLAETPDTNAINQWKMRALSLLDDAINSGYRDGVFLAGEPDLTSLKSEPKFKALLDKCSVEVTSGSL